MKHILNLVIGMLCMSGQRLVSEQLHVEYAETKREFNFSGESPKVLWRFDSLCLRIFNSMKRLVHAVKLTTIATALLFCATLAMVSITAVGVLAVMDVTVFPETLTITGVALGVANAPNKKENTMKTTTTPGFITWLKDLAPEMADSDLFMKIRVQSVRVIRGMLRVTTTTIPDAVTGKEVPLVITKKCLWDYLGLDTKFKMYHASAPLWDRTAESTRKRALLSLWARTDSNGKKWLPFGSGLKGEAKWNQRITRVKFYMVHENSVFAQIFAGAADLMGYGSLLLSDARYYTKESTLVLSREELNTIVGYEVGNNGHCYVRDRVFADLKQKYEINRNLTGIQFRAAIQDEDGAVLAIAKGVQISGRYTDEEFTELFGKEYDSVLIRGDQIKVNPEAAISGVWKYTFTDTVERKYSLPFVWELNMFLSDVKDVVAYSSEAMSAAMEALKELISTREGLIAFIDRKVASRVDAMKPVVVERKLLACLVSNIPKDFVWVKKQTLKIILGEAHRIVKSCGIEGWGQLCLTDNKLFQVSRRFISSAVAYLLGSDDDGDLIGSFWNNEIRKIAYFRFPCISGIVVVDMPSKLVGKYPDHFPKMVELFDKYGETLSISRDDLETEAIELKLANVRVLAKRLLSGLGIGRATVAQYRFLSLGKTDLARLAGLAIETDTISIKKKVTNGVECPRQSKETRDSVNTEFMGFARKVPASWKQVLETETFPETTKEAVLLNRGVALMQALYKEQRTVPVSVLDSYIEWGDYVGGNNVSERTEAVYDTYLQNIVPILKWAEKHSIDDEEVFTLLQPMLRSLETYGETLSLVELRALVGYVSDKAGPENTGAFVIHTCGSRLLDVFGVHPSVDSAMFVRPEKVSHVANYRLRVSSTKETDVAALNEVRDSFRVIDQHTCVIGEQQFMLSPEDRLTGWPGHITLTKVGVAVLKGRVRSRSAILYLRAVGS